MTALALATGLAGFGCAKVSAPNDTPTGGTGPVSTGGAGGNPAKTGGVSGNTGGTPGTGGAIIMMEEKDGGCMMAKVVFEPTIPQVFVFADRSGSVFDGTPSTFAKLRTGILAVMNSLKDQVRFGFGAFVGQGDAGSCKLDLQKVDVLSAVDFDVAQKRADKYKQIETLYNSLGAFNGKANTPAAQALATLKKPLLDDKSPGDKYIIFVTEGETDFCDDPPPVCGTDGVVWAIQDLYASKIRTLIFGLRTGATDQSDAALQAFANAGEGLPVSPLPNGTTRFYSPTDIYNNCQGSAGWKAQATAIPAAAMSSLGTYAAEATPDAKIFIADTNNMTALVNTLTAAVQGIKSCVFDLDGQGVKVNITNTVVLDGAKVLIEGAAQAHNATDGWKMNTETQLELVGKSCELWRKPASKNIDFQFPCEVIVPG